VPEGNLGVVRNRLVGGSSPPAGADPRAPKFIGALGPIDTMLEPMFYRLRAHLHDLRGKFPCRVAVQRT